MSIANRMSDLRYRMIALEADIKSSWRDRANWSKRRKATAAGVLGALALTALGVGGYMTWRAMPPGMPTSAQEAMMVMASDRFRDMDETRRQQYAAEARRLMADLPPEERRELMREDGSREAMRELMEESMDEAARRVARGEDPREVMREMMPRGPRPERPADGQPGQGQPGGGGPGGENGPRRMAGGPEGGGPGGGGSGGGGGPGRMARDPNNPEFINRAQQRLAGAIANGNPQRGALRMEMRQRMGGFGQGRSGGGGQRSGGGGGGGR